MVRTIYADILFIVNFIINYLLLFAVAHITTHRISRIRIALSAAFGALYAVFSLFPSLSFLLIFPAKLLFGFLMVLIALDKSFIIKTYLTFLALSASLAGTVLLLSNFAPKTFAHSGGFIYIDISLPLLFISSAVCYIILRIIFSRRGGGGKKTSRVIVRNDGREVTLTALLDTGNSLRTPGKGARIVISDYETLRPLLPDLATKILDERGGKNFPLALDKLSPTSRFSLVPYKTVGVSFSLLLTFAPDTIHIDGRLAKDAVCAISESAVSDGSGYNALI